MKNLIIVIALFLGSFSSAFSQVDISTTPISFGLLGRASIGAEKGLSKNIGLEANIHYNSGKILGSRSSASELKGFGYYSNLKYYVEKDNQLSGVYVGLYARDLGNELRGGFRAGFNSGIKFLMKDKGFIDMNFGFGRYKKRSVGGELLSGISELHGSGKHQRLDGFFRLAVGIRI